MVNSLAVLLETLANDVVKHSTPDGVVVDLLSGEGWCSLAALVNHRKVLHIDRTHLSRYLTRAICMPISSQDIINTETIIKTVTNILYSTNSINKLRKYIKTNQYENEHEKDIIIWLSYYSLSSNNILNEDFQSYLSNTIEDIISHKMEINSYNQYVREIGSISEFYESSHGIFFCRADIKHGVNVKANMADLIIVNPPQKEGQSLIEKIEPEVFRKKTNAQTILYNILLQAERILKNEGKLIFYIDKNAFDSSLDIIQNTLRSFYYMKLVDYDSTETNLSYRRVICLKQSTSF